MIDKKVAALLNEQINKEFYSAYLYLDFSIYYDKEGLAGFANWFRIQAQEERDHAIIFLNYMQSNGLDVTLEAIGKPDVKIEKHIDAFKEALAHEEYVTASINNIYSAAAKVKDYRTMQFLDWFIKEQGEEEETAGNNVRKMELFGSDPKSLYMLDAELGARTYVAPDILGE
ncbi:MAG: ferritin [Peptostreptococcaceae bacterium]|nr:ferritin [Peptostreptococcaceae bacterium]